MLNSIAKSEIVWAPVAYLYPVMVRFWPCTYTVADGEGVSTLQCSVYRAACV